MSMDIRSFFTTISKKTGTSPKPPPAEKPSKVNSKKRKDANSSIEDIIPETPDVSKKSKKSKKEKPEPEVKRRKIVLISDSESDDEKTKKNEKIRNNKKDNKKTLNKIETISDSESDDGFKKDTKPAPVKQSKPEVISKAKNFKPKESNQKPKKIVNPFDAFGDEPVHQKKTEKPQGTELNIHDDDEFEKTLLNLDESELIPETDKKATPKKESPIKNDKKPSPKKESPVKNDIDKKEVKHNRRSRSKSPQSSRKNSKKSDSSPTTTPNRKRKISDSEGSSADKDLERYEKKRYSAMLYQKYLNRAGPAHLHSKWIPKGKPDCLKDIGFLITGILDSLTREEAEELIVNHGGRCVKALSKKIKYLVVGEDAGPAKLEKAKDFGTTIITEDDLIDLICEKSAIENKNKSSSNENKKDHDEEGNIKNEKKNVKEEKILNKDKSSKLNLEKIKNNVKSEDKLKNNKLDIKKEDDDDIPEVTVKAEAKPKITEVKPKKVTDEKPSTSVTPKPKFEVPQKVIAEDQLAWVDKYKPTDMKSIIGQQGDSSNVKKLYNWLRRWYSNHDGTKKLVKPSPWAKSDDGSYYKAALLSGPPGVGKTTSATIVSKELGFDVVEFNASDTRSKKMLADEISTLLKSKSLSGYFKDGSAPTNKHVLLMDEVDGMSGNEDRGGMQELINLIKTSSIPIICMCNDRQHPKVRSLANYCYDLRFNKPKLEQIRGAMMSVCFKEDIKIGSEALTDVIMGAGMDIRQTLNNLSMWSAKEHAVSKETAKKEASKAVKDVKLGPWEVIRKVFSEDEHKNMSIDHKYGLFFYDYSINPLFVQENYLQVKPHCPKNEVLKRFALAADSISLGDLVDAQIRTDQKWGLLDTQALFSSVIPGQTLEGHFGGQINFPGWLGKNSKANKFKRMLGELQSHMKMSVSGSRQAVNLDYLNHIYNALLMPLVKEGMDGIPKSIAVMQQYNLMREDFTNIIELVHWPGKKDLFKNVEPKVKAAFTRAYNKDVILPYAVTAVPVKKRRGGGNENEEYNEEDEEDEEEEEDVDLVNNPMIKVRKPTVKAESKVSKTKNTTKAKESKDTKGKGPSKPRAKRGK